MSVQQIAGILNVGHEFGRFFGVHEAPSLLLASKSRPQLGITRITVTSAFSEPAGPIHRERGFTIPVYLREPSCKNWGTWVDGKFLPIEHWAEGGIGIYDMESNPRAWRTTAYDCLHFNLPRRTLDEFTADSESRRVDTLSCPQGTRDDVLLGLARFILPWLGDQAQMCDLTFDYFALMFCSHIVATYGKVRVPARRVGGLAPWQRRRVLEIVDAGFDRPLRLSTFAEACGLSLSYFNRAFKQSFGVPAHRFVTQRRVDLAKSLMMNSSMSLAEIALRSGFCDQPAFSRTFAAVVGKSPKRWLNEYRVGHASCDG